MKKRLLVAGICFLALGFIISGCAPKPTAELKKAKEALQEAKNAGAEELATSDYRAAENKLNEGKELINNCEYEEAKSVLEESARLAELAKQKALSAKKKPEAAPAPSPAPTKEVKKEKEIKPAPTPAPLKSGAEEYKVVKGDCLWNIAKKPEIYNDPFQWPLIYDANRDQIKDPDLIYPGQVFKIRRDYSSEEIETARRKAGAPRKK